jgi:hypothetical protein
MKIYVLKFDLSLAHARLKKFTLREFNDETPELFIEAKDPDEACYLGYCKFADTILSQDSSPETVKLIKEIEYDIRITRVYCKDEKKL